MRTCNFLAGVENISLCPILSGEGVFLEVLDWFKFAIFVEMYLFVLYQLLNFYLPYKVLMIFCFKSITCSYDC